MKDILNKIMHSLDFLAVAGTVHGFPTIRFIDLHYRQLLGKEVFNQCHPKTVPTAYSMANL